MTQRLAGLRDWLAMWTAGTTRRDHEALASELAQAEARFEELARRHHETLVLAESFTTNPFLTWRPPGHYYSAVPDLADLRARRFDRPGDAGPEAPGVDLRPADQLALFSELAGLIDVELVSDGGAPRARYHQPNGSFDRFDAAIGTAMLRHLVPARLIEVGSGHSSALVLDVIERHLPDLRLTCIEPYPETLRSLVRPGDDVTVIDAPVQEVPLSTFAALDAGDVLFIDSTHVVKAGSDVVDLFGRIVPSLRPGVVVHVHDIFHPFEYPWDWIAEGRAWNEAYLLRAFLAAGSEFEVLLFNNWLGRFHPDLIGELTADGQLADNARSSGSIWLRRTLP